MPKNYLLIYSEQLATDIELLCQHIKAPLNTLFQIRKSSSSVYANNYVALTLVGIFLKTLLCCFTPF